MRSYLKFAAILFLLYPISVFGQAPTVEWAKRYDGNAANLAVDAVGNVYVAGTSNGDYVTVKYDPNGNELWVKKFDSGAEDQAVALAVDASGNVYVSGASNSNIATVKYDANGNELWVKWQYGDKLVGIVLDSLGNVYMVGKNGLIIKYDTYGNEKWVKRNSTYYTALAVDLSGNVYVTGVVMNELGWRWYDIVTQKYDSNGNMKWSKLYSGPNIWTTQTDWANALTVDSSGNVYVTGYSHAYMWFGEAMSNYITIKYDASGNEKWVKLYDDGNRDTHDVAAKIAVDSSGNVFVTGQIYVVAYHTLKYDSSGNMIWVNRFSEGVVPHAPSLALDSSGNIYIGGINSPDRGFPYYAITNYDTNGNVIWTTRYGDELWTGATNLVVDSSGNAYIAINSGYSGGFVTIKYSKSASPQPTSALTASDTPCDNGGSISLSWALSPDDPTVGSGNNKVTGYNVYRSANVGGPYEAIGSTLTGVSSFVDNSATVGVSYYYVVRATDGTKESSNSNEVSAISVRNLPLPPTNIIASDTPYDLGGSITLSWMKSEDDGNGLNNVLNYNIYRYSSTSGSVVSLAAVPAGTVSYADNTTLDSDTYYYFIKALDNQCNIESSASDVVSGQSVNNLTTLSDFITTLPSISTQLSGSLTPKVDNAIASYESGNIGAAENVLGALLNEIQAAFRSGKIDSETATTLTTYVSSLITNISNQQ